MLQLEADQGVQKGREYKLALAEEQVSEQVLRLGRRPGLDGSSMTTLWRLTALETSAYCSVVLATGSSAGCIVVPEPRVAEVVRSYLGMQEAQVYMLELAEYRT